MIRIINGKTYNTKTAANVANADNGLNYGDCYLRTVELYRTKKGAYFLNNESGNIIAIDSDGNMFDGNDDFGLRYEFMHIFDYFSNYEWSEIKDREKTYFKIQEA